MDTTDPAQNDDDERAQALEALGLSGLKDLVIDTEQLVGLMALAEEQRAPDRPKRLFNPATNGTDGVEIRSMQKIRATQDRSGQFTASLDVEMCRAKRYGRPLSILAFGLSHQKGEADEAVIYRYLSLEKGLRRAAPDLLRIPDFWGKFDRQTIVFVFPETDRKGVDLAAERVVKSKEFAKYFANDIYRSDIFVGSAEIGDEIISAAGFVDQARGNVVWTSAGRSIRLD
ncbi:MAG: hypothetical protein AAGM38_15280 [Pseudomonadota bacterium]